VIQETVARYRGDLDATVKTLVKEALRGGGEDNITVVAFEIGARTEAVEELERTREHVLPPEPKDEDTLDELDGIGTLAARTGGDTMVLSVADVQAAAARERPPRRRGVLAPVLLILLVALIVALAVWGLTR
jgi:hypothetical protein